MKKVVLVSVIVVLLLATTVLATEWQDIWNGGKPFQQIWDAINNLQTQIDNMQPGPQGPPGEDGLACWDLNGDHGCNIATEDKNEDGVCDTQDCQGPEGPQGEQGSAGTCEGLCEKPKVYTKISTDEVAIINKLTYETIDTLVFTTEIDSNVVVHFTAQLGGDGMGIRFMLDGVQIGPAPHYSTAGDNVNYHATALDVPPGEHTLEVQHILHVVGALTRRRQTTVIVYPK
jgi:hypothetical protein